MLSPTRTGSEAPPLPYVGRSSRAMALHFQGGGPPHSGRSPLHPRAQGMMVQVLEEMATRICSLHEVSGLHDGKYSVSHRKLFFGLGQDLSVTIQYESLSYVFVGCNPGATTPKPSRSSPVGPCSRNALFERITTRLRYFAVGDSNVGFVPEPVANFGRFNDET